MNIQDFIEAVANRLIVSCQALPGTPLDEPEIISAIAKSVEFAGAAGLRINGVRDIKAVRRESDLPIIGIQKTDDRDGIYITPKLEQAQALYKAGASVIALQATEPRIGDCTALRELIGGIHALGLGVIADVSTLQEAENAVEMGADIVATTLSGYTPQSRQLEGPDLELVKEIAAQKIPVIAEGRYHSPQQVVEALESGAVSAVVGTMITMPDRIAAHFIRYIETAAKKLD
ncbi:MAG: N-acetylmannosamine-6-phosphate 2-epimerase [Firmicutes bacterium]|nr:N-acetylmannosamine-6-phosphate 2-epimerase [Bacillota bacterium]